jgi:hypothetical protein
MGYIDEVRQTDTQTLWRVARQLVRDLYNSNRGDAANEIYSILLKCGMEEKDRNYCLTWRLEFEDRQGEAIQYLVRNGAAEQAAAAAIDSMARYK